MKKRVIIVNRYLWNSQLTFIPKNNSIYGYRNLYFEWKFKNYANINNKFIYASNGRLCTIFSYFENQILFLFDNHKKNIYRIEVSNILGSKLNCLRCMVNFIKCLVVGMLNVFSDIITFTIIGYKPLINENKNFVHYHKFFLDTIHKIEKKTKNKEDRLKMRVINTNRYYLQKYDNLHIFIPKIFESGFGLSQNKNDQIDYKINFNNVIFL